MSGRRSGRSPRHPPTSQPPLSTSSGYPYGNNTSYQFSSEPPVYYPSQYGPPLSYEREPLAGDPETAHLAGPPVQELSRPMADTSLSSLGATSKEIEQTFGPSSSFPVDRSPTTLVDPWRVLRPTASQNAINSRSRYGLEPYQDMTDYDRSKMLVFWRRIKSGRTTKKPEKYEQVRRRFENQYNISTIKNVVDRASGSPPRRPWSSDERKQVRDWSNAGKLPAGIAHDLVRTLNDVEKYMADNDIETNFDTDDEEEEEYRPPAPRRQRKRGERRPSDEDDDQPQSSKKGKGIKR